MPVEEDQYAAALLQHEIQEDEDKDPFWPKLGADLAAIRKLLESEEKNWEEESCEELCSGCNMPFDKAKKRKLIDSCGHPRCYSCMFTQDACPLCPGSVAKKGAGCVNKSSSPSPLPSRGGPLPSAAGEYGSTTTVHHSRYHPSQDTKHNRHHNYHHHQQQQRLEKNNAYYASRNQLDNEGVGCGGRDWSPRRLPRPATDSRSPTRTNPMTHSCPTPPLARKRFFLSPKSLRSSWGIKPSSRIPSDNALSDDEGGTIKPVVWETGMKKGGISSRRNRGGGSGRGEGWSGENTEDEIYRSLMMTPGGSRSSTTTSHDSISSLASLDQTTNTIASNNTSPVSTLTGSSEAEVQRAMKDPSSESVGSLMSVSSHSNCSSSSPLQRRHSVTTTQPGRIEELNMFRNRRQSVRRSARSTSIKGPIDPKVRFAEYRNQQLPLKPLFFEVPVEEPNPVFIGREGIIKEIEHCLATSLPGVIISGHPGTGKTALMLQLVDYSCFGRRNTSKQDLHIYNGKDRPAPSQGIYCQNPNLVSERIQHLASHVVAYHFCQADNNSTCLVPDFIHSIAAQLCQAPQLSAYKEYLQSEPHILNNLTMRECIADPDGAWTRGVLEPLSSLRRVGKIWSNVGAGGGGGDDQAAVERAVIVVDALCEAEYHRPDHGHTLASFLAAHAHHTPHWLKFLLTVRTHMDEVMPPMPFQRISLDVNGSQSEWVQKDMVDYINYRVNQSSNIQSNIVCGPGGQPRLCHHLTSLAHGSMLFAKLSLDLFERGHLVAKSATYKVLPVSLAQIYLLHFNLRFPTTKSFEKVSPIISVCLAALYPLTLLEIYYSVNSLYTTEFVSWEDFLQRFKLLSGLLVKRMDNTYMFFHPSFREWLIRRDDGEPNKFLCDLRAGHAGIAFRLSRLQAPLDAEKTLELGHHILKAHLYKNMTLHKNPSRDLQAHWVASVSKNVSAALTSIRNVYSPNVKVSRLLLLSGGCADERTELLGNAPALCVFAHEGVTEMVSLLLEFGASLQATNSQGSTPLILASARGHSQVVTLLIAAGSPLGTTDTAGRCALVHAARNGHLNVVAYLLSFDWVVSDTERELELAEAAQQSLVAAAAQGHVEIVEYLLDMAEVSADGIDSLSGETALTMAAANGCSQVCSTLIKRGASISALNHKKLCALLMAVKEGHWGTAERLVGHGAPLEQADVLDRAPLSVAAAEGHVGLIELLLDKGADLNRADKEGVSALGWACLRGRLQAAHCLLDRGADVNKLDHQRRTALDLAAQHGNPAIVQLLLERGAVLEHVDVNGVRPLDRAISCRNLPVVQSFLKKGAKLGPTTWSLAAGKNDIMIALLNKLLEDGNVLYRKNRLAEAAHRYKYALNKFPPLESLDATFTQLRLNFLLNHSRCKRKMNEPAEAVELATQVLKQKPDCYEAYYARAKARVDLRNYDEAMKDVQEALLVLPSQNLEVRRILLSLRDQIRRGHRTASVDTLNQSVTSL